MRWVRRIVLVLVAIAAGLSALLYGKRAASRVAAPSLRIERTAERLARGRYLVDSVAACGACHTTGSFSRGAPSTAKYLAGDAISHPRLGLFRSPNVTPARSGIADWSDGDLYRALKFGQRPDGNMLFPAMPYAELRQLTDDDLYAIIAYLRTVPPVENELPARSFKPPFNVLVWSYVMYPQAMKASIQTVEPGDPVSRGRYMAMAAHCNGCHQGATASDPERPDEDHPWVGGFEFRGPWGKSFGSNLTADRDTGIGRYDDAALRRILTTGIRPDGTEVAPPMQQIVAHISSMTEADRTDLILFLRKLPPVRNVVPRSEIDPGWRQK